MEGQPYHRDLDRIKEEKRLIQLDKDRCQALSNYIADVHAVKKDAPQLYVRRLRDLVGHGEGIMGLCDSYPSGLDYIDDKDLRGIEKRCAEWRWKIRSKTHRFTGTSNAYRTKNLLHFSNNIFIVHNIVVEKPFLF